ncbi:MAG: hypothetical protein RLN96_04490, partial [Pseudomonadales bacterium]
RAWLKSSEKLMALTDMDASEFFLNGLFGSAIKVFPLICMIIKLKNEQPCQKCALLYCSLSTGFCGVEIQTIQFGHRD